MTEDSRVLVAKMPKAELHRHLEGSIRLSTIADLAQTYGLPLPKEESRIAPRVRLTKPARNLKGFLQPFIHVMRYCFVNEEVIARITYEVIEDAVLDGINYLELRFSAECMAFHHRLPLEAVLDGIVQGRDIAMSRYPIRVGLILSVNRPPLRVPHCAGGPKELANIAVKYAEKGVVGFDLSGLESRWPASRFTDEIRYVQEAGLGVTIHAGEGAGPESVRQAIEAGASRIGHGVRAVQDEAIVRLAMERGVCFEMCPTSNVLTRAVRSLQRHPIRRLYDIGVKVTVNTDDPTVCGVTLTDECMTLMEHFGFEICDIETLMDNARKAAFSKLD